MSPRSRAGAHAEGKTPRPKRAPRYRRGEPIIEQSRVKRSFSDWRIALRIARRSVLRTLGTSAVVVTMVALPVAGFSAAALVGESAVPNADERITAELGSNEARLYADNAPDPTLVQKPFDPRSVEYAMDPATGKPLHEGAGAEPVNPRTVFPAGTEFIELRETGVTAETAGGKGQLSVVLGPIWSDFFAGRTAIVDGREPLNASELLATAAALERLGASVGSKVQILKPDERTVTVVGILDDGMYPDEFEALYFPSTAWPDLPAAEVSTSWYLPDTIIDRDELSRINKQGITALSRAVLEDASLVELNINDSFWLRNGLLLALAAAFAVFEIILLAGAAFAVGARKQQRSLATVASVGGSRRILYRIVTAQGLVLGLIGGIAGVAVGIPAGTIFMTVTNDGSATQYWGYHLNAVAMLVIVILAAGVGLLSAVAPARAATRFDVLAALRGSRKPATPNRKAPTIGLVLLIGGAAATLAGALLLRFATGRAEWQPDLLFWIGMAALVLGPILAQIGVISCGALVLRSIARTTSRGLGLGARLASRDSAAHPSRAVPAFAAIMVTAFIGVVVINYAASSQHQAEVFYSHQIAPGQVQAWVPTDRDGTPTTDPEELATTLDSVMDVKTIGVVSAVHTTYDDNGAVLDEATPWPTIPPENLCPSDPQSPSYDAAVFEDPTAAGYYTASQDLAAGDWRCAQGQVQYVYGNGTNSIFIADAETLGLILGHTPRAEAVKALESGGAVSLRRHYVTDGTATIAWWDKKAINDGPAASSTYTPVKTETLPALVEEPDVELPFGFVISPKTADRLGIDTMPSSVLATLDSPATQEQLDATTAALEPLGTSAYYEQGPRDNSLIWILGALGLCGILFLGASAVSIGLSRADGRQDDATLTAVGATRMLRRSFAFWQALITVGIGVFTGTAAALLTTYAISLLDTTGTLGFIPPWPVLAALVIGMPLVIASGSWLVASRPTTLAHRMSVS